MEDFFKRGHFSIDYREEAKRICDLHVDKLAIVTLVYLLISVVVIIIDNLTGTTEVVYDIEITKTWFNGVFTLICGGPLGISFAYIAKNIQNGIEPKISDLLTGFKEFTKAFVLNLLITIFTALWTILLIVPGIIKGLSYSMAYYVAIDTDMTPNECIKESQRIMQGHKWDYFCLLLSYFGWIFLSVLTCGILFIWVLPRINQASYLFYLDITGLGLQQEIDAKTVQIEESIIEE